MDKELKMKVLENIFRMMVVNGKDEEDGVEEGEGKGDDGVREEEVSKWLDSKWRRWRSRRRRRRC